MTGEKLTAKKVLPIVVLTAIGTVTLYPLYLGILIFSLPLTGNMRISWILSLSIVMGIILLPGGYLLMKRYRGKPELTTLEACHRLAPSEGQKENKGVEI